MTVVTRSALIVPEILEAAIKGAFAGMKALQGSSAAIMNASLPGSNRGGDTVKVPYFGTLGEMEDVAENVALTPAALTMSSETATVIRSGKAFEMTTWAQMASQFADPYAEASRQVAETVQRRMDKALMDCAFATSGLPAQHVQSIYNSGSPATITYAAMVNAKQVWGDEQDDIAMVVVHSKVFGDMLKITDGFSRPLLTNANDAALTRFVGMPIRISDRMPVDLTTLTSTGTTPPTLTITGTPTAGIIQLTIKCTTLGARGTSKIEFSTDGGSTYSAEITTSGTATALGTTGLYFTCSNAAAATDNVWTAVPKFTTALIKRGALVYWYNGNPSVQIWHDPLLDADIAAVHLYHVAYRYNRMPGGTKPGVVLLNSN